MNANINYDEIPDTSAVQEDLLAALSSQHVTVHTNEEPDFDYMENGDVAFVVKNPHNDENLLIELGGEFSVFFGLWHGQYKAVEYDYDRMKKGHCSHSGGQCRCALHAWPSPFAAGAPHRLPPDRGISGSPPGRSRCGSSAHRKAHCSRDSPSPGPVHSGFFTISPYSSSSSARWASK